MEELFDRSARQLVSFAQSPLPPGRPTAVAPVRAGNRCDPTVADALTGRLTVALAQQPCFALLERDDWRSVLDERDFQRAMDGDDPVPMKLPRAEILIVSRLDRIEGRYVLVLKAVRVATGELISASLLKIDPRLL